MKKAFLYTLILFIGSTMAWANNAGESVTSEVVLITDGFDFKCNKFGKGPDSLKSIQNYSLYREYFKQKNYNEAMKFWPSVYRMAPTLNTRVISNGITYYNEKMKAAEKGPVKDMLLDSLIMLYSHKMHCYGDEVKVKSKLGWLLQTYRPEEKEEVQKLYKDVIDKGGNKAPYYTLLPFFQGLINDLDKDKVTAEEVLKYKDVIQSIVDANAVDAKYGKLYVSKMQSIESMFNNNKKVGSMFDCNVMGPIMKADYEANKNNIAWVKSTYYKMKKGCEDDPFTQQLFLQYINLEPTSKSMMYMYNKKIKSGDKVGAQEYLQKAIALETDPIKKASYIYREANVKYAAKDFQGARKLAKEAISVHPNYGKAYLLIGKLYAASGKLCGPGTGYESQKVIFPALDYFNKAKQVDSSVGEEAQKLINKYWAYLPDKSEMFMKGIKVGSPIFIGCWIQENSTVRAQ